MPFSSVTFIWVFLPTVLVVGLLSPRPARNTILLLASLAFYEWGGGTVLFWLLASIAGNFLFGLYVERFLDAGNQRAAHRVIAVSVVTNLALLAWFKYANFLVDQVANVISWFGGDGPHLAPIALPVGISFFTFQAMSYAIDISRGRARALKNPIDFALYIAFFPQLIAGPIVRFHEIAPQLKNREVTVDGFTAGVLRFGHGLAKKVIIADAAAQLADQAFAVPNGEMTFLTAWVGALAYTVQIYFDFSGYSDMAIGLGMMFGFAFPENFRRPYSSISVTDFWRRWHITLSTWFRDYLYVPLGGSRGSQRQTIYNLLIVFTLTGLWHGANWTFIVWGAYYGVLVVAERVTGQRPVGDADVSARAVRRALTLLVVVFGWVIFRAADMDQAFTMLGTMIVPSFEPLASQVQWGLPGFDTIAVLVGMATALLPGDWVTGPWLASGRRSAQLIAARSALMFGALPYSLLIIQAGTLSPFIYFRF